MTDNLPNKSAVSPYRILRRQFIPALCIAFLLGMGVKLVTIRVMDWWNPAPVWQIIPENFWTQPVASESVSELQADKLGKLLVKKMPKQFWKMDTRSDFWVESIRKYLDNIPAEMEKISPDERNQLIELFRQGLAVGVADAQKQDAAAMVSYVYLGHQRDRDKGMWLYFRGEDIDKIFYFKIPCREYPLKEVSLGNRVPWDEYALIDYENKSVIQPGEIVFLENGQTSQQRAIRLFTEIVIKTLPSKYRLTPTSQFYKEYFNQNFVRATELYPNLPESDRNNPVVETMYAEAFCDYFQLKILKGECSSELKQQLKDLIDKSGNKFSAWLIIPQANYYLGRFESDENLSYENLIKMTEITHDPALIPFYRGMYCQENDKQEEAIDFYRQAYELGMKNAALYYLLIVNLGTSSVDESKVEEVARLIEEALTLFGDNFMDKLRDN